MPSKIQIKPSRRQPKALFLLVCLLLLSLVIPPHLGRAAAPTLQDPAELEAFLDGAIGMQMQLSHLPGVTVSVVKDGTLFFSKGYGFADLEKRIPVDPARTLFRPGSISKLFTWTAVMQLVESGRLDLDADVNTYLDFTIPATFPEPITLRNLMTHTAGFEDKGEGLFQVQAEKMSTLELYLKTYLPERVFPAGKLGAYSNYGTALAGYIIERTSGMPFTEYIEKNIFAPLGMTHSTFRQPLPAELAPNMANGYNFGNGSYIQGGFEFISGSPAGALSASAEDMARFMIAHLQNGQYGEARILQEATAIEMHSQLFTPDPRLPGMAYGFFQTPYNGHEIISHPGDTMLFHSGLYLILDQNVGFFISTNGAGGGPAMAEVYKAFMNHYFPGPAAAAPQPDANFAQQMVPYLGNYTQARGNFSGFEKVLSVFSPISASMTWDGYLMVTVLGQTNQYVGIEPGLLQDRYDPNIRLAYRTDPDGQAYLLPSTPFALIKTPWYGSANLFLQLVGLSVFLFLGAMIGWPLEALRRRSYKPANQPTGGRPSTLARWVAVCFGLLMSAFLVGVVGLISAPNPAYGVPDLFFETPSILNILMLFPYGMLILCTGMLGFTLLAWKNHWWWRGSRLHYSLLSGLGLATIALMIYWNLLF